MKASKKTEAEVIAVLETFGQAYTKSDRGMLLSLFAPDADLVFIGSGWDERRVGAAEVNVQFHRDRSQARFIGWDWTWRSVSARGPVAWAAAEASLLVSVQRQRLTLPRVRFTAVLEKRDGGWRIVQGHTSVPAFEPEEEAAAATEVPAKPQTRTRTARPRAKTKS